MTHSKLFGWAAACALLLLVLAIACGPAAAPGRPLAQSAPAAEPDPTPSPDPNAPEPTVTPKPTSPPPPTKDPEKDKPARPTPTRSPDDPLPPTPKPSPERRVPTGNPLPVDEPHPDGMDGCRAMNIFSMPYSEDRYWTWCMEALSADLRENCRGEGSTQAELACAANRLADVQSYLMRLVFVPCAAVSNEDDYLQCGWDSPGIQEAHFRDLVSVWNDVVAIVEADAEVKARYGRMAECVRDAGHEPPERPLVWHQIDPDKIADKANRQTTGEERAAEEERLRLINRCALDTGLYEAQDAAWQIAIRDIADAAPHRVKPLEDERIIAVLEQPGPAPFLTIRQFTYGVK